MKTLCSLLAAGSLCWLTIPCPAQGITEGDVILSDDFSRFTDTTTDLGTVPGTDYPWGKRIPTVDGQVQETLVRGMNGRLIVGYRSGVNPHDTGVFVEGLSLADGLVELRLGESLMARPSNVTVSYRALDSQSAAGGMQPGAYHVQVSGDWAGSRDVILRYGAQALAVADVADSRGPKHTCLLKVAFAQNRHIVWLDGRRIIDFWEYEPDRDAAGSIGFGAYYSIAAFDDFSVKQAKLDVSQEDPSWPRGQMRPLIYQGRPIFVIGSFDPPREHDTDDWLDAGFNTVLMGVMRESQSPEQRRAQLRESAQWAADHKAAAVYYPLINMYGKDGDQATITDPKDIPAKAALLQEMLEVTAQHPNTLGYWTFDEPENHVYKAYGQWEDKKDTGLAEWMAEGLKWTYETLKAGDPDAYVMPTIAWWTTYKGLAPLYDVNVPNTYPCGVKDAPLQAPMYQVVYDAALAADAVRETGRHSFIFMPPTFDVIDGGRAATRAEFRYLSLAPVTQGAMGILGWRLGRCSDLYRQMVIYPVTKDVRRLVPWLLGQWCDEKVSSDHDEATAEYLKELPVRVKLIPGEETDETVQVPGVPDCSYALRRRPDNTYLLLAVNNRKEPLTVTFTLRDIPGLPSEAMDYIEYAKTPIRDGQITESFEPFGVRAWVIRPG